MNKQTTQAEAPRKPSVRERVMEYIEIRKTTPISVVDIISWFCASACLIATLYWLYSGSGLLWGSY